MTSVATGLESAREAVSRYAWREAFALFAAADAATPLDSDDLDWMAECAWWIGKMRHCIALRERAHASYLKADNVRRAARVAIELADHHGDLGEMADATGWIQKATRMLEDLPEGPEHGWLSLGHALMGRAQGDMKGAGGFAAEAAQIGARHGDKDLFALGHAVHGVVIAFTDDPDRGLPMVEEATQGAVAGDLGPRATGWIYCMMIAVNAQLADWQRAGHWSEAATRWCNRQSINGFPGVCRVHRAEIMRLRGSFADAEEEARVATTELASFNLMFTAMAFHELGEVRVRMGDLDAAEEALAQAKEMGISPQPGLSLALLQRGRPQAAATSLRRALAGASLGPLDRAKLLPAQLEVALLQDDVELARAVAAELATIAQVHDRPALRATAAAAAASVALVDGAYAEGEQAARHARGLFDEIDLCYESARVSLLLGQILQAAGEVDRAHSEMTKALVTFENLGAVPDAKRAREVLAGRESSRDDVLRSMPLFADCTEDELARIAPLFDELDVDKGAALTHQGQAGHSFIVIVEGTAEVRTGDEVVRSLGAGDFLGEIAMVAGGTRTASVVATTPMRVLVISHSALEKVENDVPGVRAKIEQTAAERLREDRAAEFP